MTSGAANDSIEEAITTTASSEVRSQKEGNNNHDDDHDDVTSKRATMIPDVPGRPNHTGRHSLAHLSTRVVRCSLDEDQCLSLCDILASFQTAVNEEQAWALCYQTV